MCRSSTPEVKEPVTPAPPVQPPPQLEQIVPEQAEEETTAKKQKKKAVGTKKYQTPLNISKTTSTADGSGVNTAR